MRTLIAIFALILVASFSTPVRAAEESNASTCSAVWDKAHAHVMYFTCPTGEVEWD